MKISLTGVNSRLSAQRGPMWQETEVVCLARTPQAAYVDRSPVPLPSFGQDLLLLIIPQPLGEYVLDIQ